MRRLEQMNSGSLNFFPNHLNNLARGQKIEKVKIRLTALCFHAKNITNSSIPLRRVYLHPEYRE